MLTKGSCQFSQISANRPLNLPVTVGFSPMIAKTHIFLILHIS
jgi:hypothetical protein